jgi:glycerol kinase
MAEFLLALDAGTTTVRALIAHASGEVRAVAGTRIATRFPAPGRVEQDAGEIWGQCQGVIAGALAEAGLEAVDLAAVGVTTQRAATVVWDAVSGEPAAPMVVWSDQRGLERARSLNDAGFMAWPQTPACKLEEVLAGADPRDLAWGTLDSYLVNRLSGGALHLTDLSNAWFSGYLDFARPGTWNEALTAHQRLGQVKFPDIVDTFGRLGTAAAIGPKVALGAVVADQQAGMFAHDALASGAWKATFGTSAVALVCTGAQMGTAHPTMPVEPIAAAGLAPVFGYEGMVITWGAFVDWACGALGLFVSPAEMEALARGVSDGAGAAVRPSLLGLGAPHGRFDAAAVFAGLNPAVSRAHLAWAMFEGLALRMVEVLTAMRAHQALPDILPVDGGGAGDLAMQLLADLSGLAVRRHKVRQASAYGAAAAAGLGSGLLTRSDLAAFARYEDAIEPALSRDEAVARLTAWQVLVGAT